jgi:hypothetical protein
MTRERNVPDSQSQMEDDLAVLARDAEARLAHWDALAAGRCTLDEAKAAARAAGQSDEEIARAAELFAPMDEARFASIAAAVDRSDASNVVRPSRWQRPAIAAALAALAAGAVLWMSRSPTTATAPAAAMVEHELSIRGVAEVRGDAVSTPSVPAGATLPILLRPSTKHDVAPHVWACAVQGDTRIQLATEVANGVPGRAIEANVVLPRSVVAGTWELQVFVSSTAAPKDPCATEPAAHVVIATSDVVVR